MVCEYLNRTTATGARPSGAAANGETSEHGHEALVGIFWVLIVRPDQGDHKGRPYISLRLH
jgi:hypothetical protein